MKHEPNVSNESSTSQDGLRTERRQSRQAGQASQEQPKKSENTLGLHTVDTQLQSSGASGKARQQQADTGSSKKGEPSPSRDQGYSPSDSSKSVESIARSGNITRKSVKKD